VHMTSPCFFMKKRPLCKVVGSSSVISQTLLPLGKPYCIATASRPGRDTCSL